ncbi:MULTISPECIES: hypothetical protein [Convivina]|nr:MULTISPECIES: hypothetical protein [Convivina]CAH1855694.1 hypothetical protein R077811_01096 [Convivina intestini]CAH1855759.1 hypothetical protein R078138_01205 [Convivina sp. LMG 32447]
MVEGKIVDEIFKFTIDVLQDKDTKKSPEMVGAIAELLKTTGFF